MSDRIESNKAEVNSKPKDDHSSLQSLAQETWGWPKTLPAKESLGEINPSGVNQKGVGDCFFDAALASQANSQKGQDQIREMIKTNDDGSYTVTFPGDKGRPVRVTSDDIKDNKDKRQVGNSAEWANVIETAFLKYNNSGQLYNTGGISGWGKQGVPYFSKVNMAGKALELLTGEDVSTDSTSVTNFDNRELTLGATSKENIEKDIQRALANGEPITACAPDSKLKWIGENNADPVQDAHVYSILDYNPRTEMLTVRNPWGSNNGTKLAGFGTTVDGITNFGDGKLQMSMDTFMNTFADINFAGRNPYANDASNLKNDFTKMSNDQARFYGDVAQGKWDSVPQDFKKVLADPLQVTNSAMYVVSDSAERAVKSAVNKTDDVAHNVIDGTRQIVKNVVDNFDPRKLIM